jgi:hypothetical protein
MLVQYIHTRLEKENKIMYGQQIKTFLENVTQENYQDLSENFLNTLEIATHSKGEKYTETSMINIISELRKEIKVRISDDNFRENLLKVLVPKDSHIKEKKELFKTSRSFKNTHNVFFNPYKLIEQSEKYITSNSIHELIAITCFLTGRRPNEVCLNGLFFKGDTELSQAINDTREHLINLGYNVDNIPVTTIDFIHNLINVYHNSDNISNGNYLLFGGQSKQHKDSLENTLQPYPIPCLLKDTKVIDIIDRIRTQINITVPEGQEHRKNKIFNDKYGKNINEASKRIFKGLLPIGATSCSELRAIYAVSCYEIFQGVDSLNTQQYYYSKILGHSENSLDSSFSYSNYKVRID